VKKHTMANAAASILILAAFSASAADPTSCSLGTLHGTMAWASIYANASVPRAGSGFESYDGHGGLKYTQLVSDGYTTHTYTGTGTYTITANCIASVTYDGVGRPFLYFVAPDGSAYFWSNNQNAGVVSAGRVERVSHALLVK
jgi:hypothetical protein